MYMIFSKCSGRLHKILSVLFNPTSTTDFNQRSSSTIYHNLSSIFWNQPQPFPNTFKGISFVKMSKWDAQTDAALFLTIMEVSDIKVSDWQKIATRMNEKGHSLSKEGCRYVFCSHWLFTSAAWFTSHTWLSRKPTLTMSCCFNAWLLSDDHNGHVDRFHFQKVSFTTPPFLLKPQPFFHPQSYS